MAIKTDSACNCTRTNREHSYVRMRLVATADTLKSTCTGAGRTLARHKHCTTTPAQAMSMVSRRVNSEMPSSTNTKPMDSVPVSPGTCNFRAAASSDSSR